MLLLSQHLVTNHRQLQVPRGCLSRLLDENVQDGDDRAESGNVNDSTLARIAMHSNLARPGSDDGHWFPVIRLFPTLYLAKLKAAVSTQPVRERPQIIQ